MTDEPPWQSVVFVHSSVTSLVISHRHRTAHWTLKWVDCQWLDGNGAIRRYNWIEASVIEPLNRVYCIPDNDIVTHNKAQSCVFLFLLRRSAAYCSENWTVPMTTWPIKMKLERQLTFRPMSLKNIILQSAYRCNICHINVVYKIMLSSSLYLFHVYC